MITKLLNYFRTPITGKVSYVEEDNSVKVINDIGEFMNIKDRYLPQKFPCYLEYM